MTEITGADVLREALNGVPGAILLAAARPPQERIARADECADVIAHGADALWAHERKRWHPGDGPRRAEVAQAVMEGLAVLACRPGGAVFGGLHWHAEEHEDCPGPGGLSLKDMERRSATGAYFTPRYLVERVTLGALEPLVYRPGPLQHPRREEWRLVSSHEIMNLRTGDIACGSGAFLLACCRYLAGRLAEAWRAEAGEAPPPTWERDVFPPLPGRGPLVMAARRVVIRCVHGVDIDPTAVEMARLSLALMAPMTPSPVEMNVVAGDALLGITDVEQVLKMRWEPAPGMPDALDRELFARQLSALAAHRRAQA